MDDPRIAELARFTHERHLSPNYGDSYLFFVGRDNVHSILKHLIAKEMLSLKFSMFGYDDDELNQVIMHLMRSRHVRVQASLDKRQASLPHERKLLELDQHLDPVNYQNSFVITNSPTGEILHTKGGVCVGYGVAFEGSTNWSASGEGTNLSRAQSNTLLVSTNPVLISRFAANLDNEHAIGFAKQAKN